MAKLESFLSNNDLSNNCKIQIILTINIGCNIQTPLCLNVVKVKLFECYLLNELKLSFESIKDRNKT